MYSDNKIVLAKFAEYCQQKKFRNKRMQQDLSNFDESEEIRLDVVDDNESQSYYLMIQPGQNSIWIGFDIKFQVEFPHNYPFKPLSIKCLTQVFHPNITDDGKICLNLLKEDWNPSYGLNEISQALLSMFYSFNTEDPLNKESSDLYLQSTQAFRVKIASIKKQDNV